MRNFGWQEILIVLGITLVLFGGKILPFAGRRMAQSVRALRGAFQSKDDHA